VRLLLDAHVSGRAIGARLRVEGHDVLALDERPDLQGLPDPEVLALAAAEGRVLVTFNIKDFPDLVREWAGRGRPHAGCLLVVGIRQHEFGATIRALQAALQSRPDPDDWTDRTVFLSRVGG